MRDKRSSPAAVPAKGHGMPPAERSLRARLAAHAMHARQDAQQTTTAAGAAFLARFGAEVDPALSTAPTSPAASKAAGQPLFYTLREAAALLQISEATYYRSVREGRLPGRKVGGQWRVARSALHRYAEDTEPGVGGDAA
jgi:excisionase family DNA binding protein